MQDIEEFVREVFPPSTGENILRLLAKRAGQLVSLEDMAIAAYGDNPLTWRYASSEAWYSTVQSHMSSLRRRFRDARLDVDIETVHNQGYRLVERTPRRRWGKTELRCWRVKMLTRYDEVRQAHPDLSLVAICAVLNAKSRRKLPYKTLHHWLRQRARPAP